MEGATLQKIAQQAVDGKVSVEQVQQAKGSLSPPTVRADVAASAANKILTSEPPQNPTDLAARTNEPNSADKGWGWSKWLPSSAAIQEVRWLSDCRNFHPCEWNMGSFHVQVLLLLMSFLQLWGVFVQAAAGALRDVRELNESLQQVNFASSQRVSFASSLAYKHLDH